MRERDKFEHDLRAISCLPPDDPVRMAFEQEALRDTESTERWLAQLADVERIRLSLRQARVPAGLQDRLLAVPSRRPRNSWWRPIGSVALVGSLVCAFVMLGVIDVRARRQPPVVLGLYAMEHVSQHVPLQRRARRDLLERLQAAVPYRVELPDNGGVPVPIDRVAPAVALVGGDVETFRGHPIVHTVWTGKDGQSSLFQFNLADFNVPPSERYLLPLHELEPQLPSCRVELWTHDSTGFLLLTDVGGTPVAIR